MTTLPIPAGLTVRKEKDDLCEQLITKFQECCGGKPEVVACGPGRVNLIGEHTDYQNGFVFPIALDRKTAVAVGRCPSGKFRCASLDMDKKVEWDELPAKPADKPEWWAYIVGCVRIFCEVAKVELPKGLCIMCKTTVPIGGGLSSSAALEVATMTAMEVITNKTLGPLEKALACQKAEHEWAKVPCGLMDQAIGVMGRKSHAMMFDCKTCEPTHAPLPDDVAVVVVDSGVRHSLVDGQYAARKAHCIEAVKGVQKVLPHVKSLRDLPSVDDLATAKCHMSPEAFKRGSHVIAENLRSAMFFDFLQQGELDAAGSQMYEGHASLRDLYDVTVPETDKIVEIAKELPGVIGARMTGGGFGGCVCILCRKDCAEGITKEVLERYTPFFEERKKIAHDGIVMSKPTSFVATASDGCHVYAP